MCSVRDHFDTWYLNDRSYVSGNRSESWWLVHESWGGRDVGQNETHLQEVGQEARLGQAIESEAFIAGR